MKTGAGNIIHIRGKKIAENIIFVKHIPIFSKNMKGFKMVTLQKLPNLSLS